jgi:acetyl-CoA C-acetyltransferase
LSAAAGSVGGGVQERNMADSVHVIGTARTDFKRNLLREGRSLRDLVVEVGRGALADAAIGPREVRAGVVGNFAAGLFTRQLHLGAMLADVDPALVGIPTVHTEAACASGGVAVLTGAEKIMAGVADVVLVVGVEQQKTMAPAEGADVLGAAADFATEKPVFGEYLFPRVFGRIAELYAERHGLTEEDLAHVAAKAYAHARLNPLAQMRDKLLDLERAATESQTNPRVAGPLKLSDCSQITDGAAAAVLCSGEFAGRLGRSTVRLAGFGQTTDVLDLARKDAPTFPVARLAAAKAYAMAEWGPADLDGVDIHDCFSITEIIACEVLGLTESGRGAELARRGVSLLPQVRKEREMPAPPRSVPVNPGGGLLADGHPVGATGVRQVDEMYRQLTGRADARQIPGAKRYGTFNLGGSLTTSVVMLWEQT